MKGNRHRPVVDQMHLHVRRKLPGLHHRVQLPSLRHEVVIQPPSLVRVCGAREAGPVATIHIGCQCELADAEQTAGHVLHAAVQIEKLATTADLHARNGNGRTALHVATFAKRHTAIRALVKAGANINLRDKDRYDGVTIASVDDDEDTLRVLLALGASAKQITSSYGGTALIAAAHLGHAGVARKWSLPARRSTM